MSCLLYDLRDKTVFITTLSYCLNKALTCSSRSGRYYNQFSYSITQGDSKVYRNVLNRVITVGTTWREELFILGRRICRKICIYLPRKTEFIEPIRAGKTDGNLFISVDAIFKTLSLLISVLNEV